ncbi:hypothetical protein NT01CX_1224 [Clostridium novyi NT]|uniref:Uncharacterized protein n=1 Tax=Clostridium novyi (strain NT) TaxID=386415 RepID=A0PY55_CLONN|nr:hypothetical protein NT01CX_1224 [Clostridium novyi NT]
MDSLLEGICLDTLCGKDIKKHVKRRSKKHIK